MRGPRDHRQAFEAQELDGDHPNLLGRGGHFPADYWRRRWRRCVPEGPLFGAAARSVI